MGVEIPPGYGQATLIFQCDGVPSPMNVTFGYEFAGQEGDGRKPDVQAAAIRTAAVAANSFLPAAEFSSEYVFMGVDVNTMDGTGEGVGTSRFSLRGSIVGSSPLPPNCAILVKKNTAIGGRKFKGRMYLPPMFWGEGEVSASGYNAQSSVYNDLQARLATFIQLLGTAGYPMMLLHSIPGSGGEFGGGDFPGDPPPPTLVTSLTVQPQIATQRRRLR